MKSLAERIPTLPGPVRSVLRNAVWTYGTATARLRPLPDFLILGAQKAGTTALYEYLRRHPGITGPRWKEVSYFDRHYARGRAWYRGNFPVRDGGLVGEASPSYLFHPLAPERAAALVPGARLIAILRDPVERAYSHYQHELSFGREPLSFEEALEREEARMAGELERMLADPGYFSHAWWNFTYRSRGLYAEQLERWRAVFGPDRLLVLANEELVHGAGLDLCARARVPGSGTARARRIPACLRSRLPGHASGDAGAVGRLLRRAEPPSLRAARPRARVDVDSRP